MARPTRSLLHRLSISYALLFVITAAAFVFVVFENQLDLIAESAVVRSQLTATRFQIAAEELGDSPVPGTERRLDEVTIAAIRREAEILGIDRLELFTEDGQALGGDSPASDEQFRNIQATLVRRDFENSLFHHELDRQQREIRLYVPVAIDAGSRVVAEATIVLSQVDRQIGYLYRQVAVVVGFVLFVHLVFVFTFSRLLFSPLRAILGAVRHVSEGSLDVQVQVARNDELGELAGAFNTMSEAVVRMREEARGANPLTGLPGNRAIAAEIDEKLRNGAIIAVIHSDLDNFKAYNDAYGFSRGDTAILFTRDCLLAAAREAGDEAFVGHEGGDDFVTVISHAHWETFCREVVRRFDDGVGAFYNTEDREAGFIDSTDRQGNPRRFPLMSISLAVATNEKRPFSHHAEIIAVATDVKKIAKSISGSSYAVDQRGIDATAQAVVDHEHTGSG